jgi:hypothetical protein
MNRLDTLGMSASPITACDSQAGADTTDHRDAKKISLPHVLNHPLALESPCLGASVVKIAALQAVARRHIAAQVDRSKSQPQKIVHPTG